MLRRIAYSKPWLENQYRQATHTTTSLSSGPTVREELLCDTTTTAMMPLWLIFTLVSLAALLLGVLVVGSVYFLRKYSSSRGDYYTQVTSRSIQARRFSTLTPPTTTTLLSWFSAPCGQI